MKRYFSILFVLLSYTVEAQFAVKNYSNAPIDQTSTIQQIVDWIQFNQINNVAPFFSDTTLVDLEYLNIESTYLSKEYSRAKIDSSEHIEVEDQRQVYWYERNIYKINKGKLKPRYQIYITVENSEDSFKILDLKFGKRKKINTSHYN